MLSPLSGGRFPGTTLVLGRLDIDVLVILGASCCPQQANQEE